MSPRKEISIISALPAPEGVRLLKDLGYHGVGSVSAAKLPAIQKACEMEGFPLLSIYVGGRVNADSYELDPGLAPAIRSLQGRNTVVELFLQKGTNASDAQAIAMVRDVAAKAADAGLKVVIYPHSDFYIERLDHAFRIATASGRDNVGVAFNLCHFLKVQPQNDLAAALQAVAPRLWSVSLCGADQDGRDWNGLIRPLDEGSFKLSLLLETLRKVPYREPIGLQCYNIRLAPAIHLQRSMTAWKKHLLASQPGQP